MTGPLAGVRVIEVANMIAAPSAAAMMADLGADVIKVEPPTGDILRNAHRPLISDRDNAPDAWWHLDNRGKKGIVVALDRPQGRAIVHRLAANADVFITNLTGERREKYKLTEADVHEVAPNVIYTGVGGYGNEGPWAGRPAYDMTAFFARGGIGTLIPPPDEGPPGFRPGQGDHTTALAILCGVLAALRERDRTGEGQTVDVALFQVAAWTISSDLSVSLLDGARPVTPPRSEWRSPLTCRFRCRDDRWLALCMPGPRDFWPAFCAAIDKPEWTVDERYATPQARDRNAIELIALVDARLADADRVAWADIFDDHGLIWAPCQTMPELIEDPQAWAVGMFASIDDPTSGSFETVATPFHLNGSPPQPAGPAPSLGQHTRAVLATLGLTEDEIDALVASGTVV